MSSKKASKSSNRRSKGSKSSKSSKSERATAIVEPVKIKAKASKINRRSIYMTRARPNKKLRLWIPPSLNMDDYQNQLVLLLSQLAIKAEPIDTKTNYNDDFENFYNIHIKSKYDNKTINDLDDEQVKSYKRKKNFYFCASDQTGGVDLGYIIQTARRKDTATILSLDVDETSGEILEVYALASFNVSNKKMAIHVSTLCGNQVLPQSGEGTRLLTLIENTGHSAGLSKVFLDPVLSAATYYEGRRYSVMDNRDSSGTGSSSKSSSTSSSSTSSSSTSSSSPSLHMQKNVGAQKNWNKVRSAYNMRVLLGRDRKASVARGLKDESKRVRDEEIASRPPLTGKPINPVGLSLGIHNYGKTSKNPSKMTRGTSIVPGESLRKRHRTMKRHRHKHKQ